jgi:hypothetical protein
MYVMRFPPKLAALGWPFIVALVASTIAVAASIASSSSAFRAIILLYIVPASVSAVAAWLICLIYRSVSPPSLASRCTLSFLLDCSYVSSRLAGVALYYLINLMHYVPLVVATWPVAALPPPPNRTALFSILPVTALLTPIFLFLVNNAGLFLLGLYTVTPPPNLIAAQSRAQLSTLLTHELHLLASVTCAGAPVAVVWSALC